MKKSKMHSPIIRRTLSIAMMLALTLCMSVSAFAAESDTSFVPSSLETITPFYKMDSQSVLSNTGVITRGTSYPNQEYALTEGGAYNGSFWDVQAGVYTGYYFTGHSKYYVSLSNLKTSSGTSTANLYLVDMDQGSETLLGTSASLSTSSNESLDKNPTGLFTDHKYCFKVVSSSNKKISGKITVTTSF